VAGNLLLVTLGVDFTHPRAVRKVSQAMPSKKRIGPSTRDFDIVIAGKIPDDPDWPGMLGLPKTQNFRNYVWCRPISRVLRRGLALLYRFGRVTQARFQAIFSQTLV
jgi:hypothetical protein